MAFSFPTSPANGDTFVQGPVTFTYNSTMDAWVAAGSGVRSLPVGTAVGQTIHWNGAAWGAGVDAGRNYVSATAAAGGPTTRDDGTALVAGDIYTNTATNKIMLWTGGAWVESAVATTPLLTGNGTSGSPIGIAPQLVADDGKVLTVQSDGSVAWELPAAGGGTTGIITGTAAYDYQVVAVAPTTRSVAGLSAALVVGDKYFNTAEQVEYTWNGTKWVSEVVRKKSYFFSGF